MSSGGPAGSSARGRTAQPWRVHRSRGGRAVPSIAMLPTCFIPIGQFHTTSPPYETAPDWRDWRGSRFVEYLAHVPEERGTSSTGHRSSGSYQVVCKTKQLRAEHIDKWW